MEPIVQYHFHKITPLGPVMGYYETNFIKMQVDIILPSKAQDRKDRCSDNALHTYSRGAVFESRPGHRLYSLRISWFCSVSSGISRGGSSSAVVWSLQLPSKPFPIHHLLVILPLDAAKFSYWQRH
jgi:hypothetical protein